VEAFTLFNRVNFVEDSNQSSFVVFGPARIRQTLAGVGRHTQTLPARQVQLAGRLSF
jgi:hypothetical protein